MMSFSSAALAQANNAASGDDGPVYFDMNAPQPAPSPPSMVQPEPTIQAVTRPYWMDMDAQELAREAARLAQELERSDSPLTPLEKKRTRNILKQVQAQQSRLAATPPALTQPPVVPGEPVEVEQPLGQPVERQIEEALDKPAKAQRTRNKVLDSIRESRYGASPWVEKETEGDTAD